MPPKTSPFTFFSEANKRLPLPPAQTFAQALAASDPQRNSFFILEQQTEPAPYIQCGGGPERYTVEIYRFVALPGPASDPRHSANIAMWLNDRARTQHPQLAARRHRAPGPAGDASGPVALRG